jgi:LacI family transcriptional regulator
VGKVTLYDVSKAAGVGIATVSRALGDHPDVSAATRDRVRGIARQLGYRPSAAARALAAGGLRAISVIVPSVGIGWWSPVLSAAVKAAADEGYQLMVHPVVGTDASTADVVDGLAAMPTEGVIVISVPNQEAVRKACDRIPLPAVAIDDTSQNLRFATVSAANRAGARSAVEHLLQQGRRSVALLLADMSGGTAEWGEGLFIDERAAGYREALENAGLRFDESLVVSCTDPFNESRDRWPELEAAIDRGLQFDGLFAVSDAMAAIAIRTLQDRGLRVPEDVAIVGFDDERAALLSNPQLTTIRQPYDEMGRYAVELLLRQIRGEHLDERRYEFDTQLIVRTSTRNKADN